MGITRPASRGWEEDGTQRLDIRGEGERGEGRGRKHKVAWKSLSFVESFVKGGGEADVRPHTDNSTECSVEFMRFNPLRNPREAAPPPPPVFPFIPMQRRKDDGLKGWVGPARQRGPHAGDAGFKVHRKKSSLARSLPHGERAGFKAGQ